MENAKYTDADRKKVELEIKKQWERWHKRKMIEIGGMYKFCSTDR
jgi:hypothetical protein